MTAAERSRALAAKLVNIPGVPAGFEAARAFAAEARAYHNLQPYPWYHFREWKVEERGPYPRCMPFVRGAVNRSARWLFGKPLQIHCPGNVDLEEWLRGQWQANRMPTRMVAAAARGGQEGGLALKFSFDASAEEIGQPPLSIQTLSAIDEARLWFDPHDRDNLLMARIQYVYWDPVERDFYACREEWTEEEEVHYQPIRIKWQTPTLQGIRFPPVAIVALDGKSNPDDYEKWEITTRAPNPFGVIPLVYIKNVDADDLWGLGDLWGLWRVVDRVNLTMHLADRSNQFDSEPNLIFLDVDAERTEIDRPLGPGQPLSLKSDETLTGERDARGQVILVEPKGNLRPHMMDYAKDLRKSVLLTAGSIEVDQAEFTNKGALTQAVLSQLYGPLIELTDEKRKTYGEDGVSKFLELVAVGLSRAGVPVPELSGVNEDDHDSHDVQLGWPDYFALTEEEKGQVVTRVTAELGQGLTTHERAVERVAKVEGVEDVDVLKEELEDVTEAAAEGQLQQVGPEPEEPNAPGSTGKGKGGARKPAR